MAVTGLPKTPTYSNQRRKVVATADVAIQQVQVVDKSGQIRSIVLWRCGPDVLYADNLDGLFDSARRKKAPGWLTEQLSSLPQDRQFHSNGEPKSSVPRVSDAPSHVPTDNDAPDFVQS